MLPLFFGLLQKVPKLSATCETKEPFKKRYLDDRFLENFCDNVCLL